MVIRLNILYLETRASLHSYIGYCNLFFWVPRKIAVLLNVISIFLTFHIL